MMSDELHALVLSLHIIKHICQPTIHVPLHTNTARVVEYHSLTLMK